MDARELDIHIAERKLEYNQKCLLRADMHIDNINQLLSSNPALDRQLELIHTRTLWEGYKIRISQFITNLENELLDLEAPGWVST